MSRPIFLHIAHSPMAPEGRMEEHEFSGSSGQEDEEPPSGSEDSEDASEPELDEAEDLIEASSDPDNDPELLSGKAGWSHCA